MPGSFTTMACSVVGSGDGGGGGSKGRKVENMKNRTKKRNEKRKKNIKTKGKKNGQFKMGNLVCMQPPIRPLDNM